MKTHALVVMSLADLIAMDGGSALAGKWLAAQDEKTRNATVTLPASTGEPGGWPAGRPTRPRAPRTSPPSSPAPPTGTSSPAWPTCSWTPTASATA